MLFLHSMLITIDINIQKAFYTEQKHLRKKICIVFRRATKVDNIQKNTVAILSGKLSSHAAKFKKNPKAKNAGSNDLPAEKKMAGTETHTKQRELYVTSDRF